jgi:phage host-nuclease inhibitor protein Gam
MTTTTNPTTPGAGASTPAPLPPTVIEGTRLLRRIAEHRAAISRVERDAEAQLAEIIDWRASEVRQHEHEIAALEGRLQPCVDAELARNPLDRKSVRFPSGLAGYSAPPLRTVVEDVEAFIAWAQRKRPGWLRTKPPEPDLPTIKRDAVGKDCQPGPLRVAGDEAGEIEIVPGIRLERGDRSFYAKPRAVS